MLLRCPAAASALWFSDLDRVAPPPLHFILARLQACSSGPVLVEWLVEIIH